MGEKIPDDDPIYVPSICCPPMTLKGGRGGTPCSLAACEAYCQGLTEQLRCADLYEFFGYEGNCYYKYQSAYCFDIDYCMCVLVLWLDYCTEPT